MVWNSCKHGFASIYLMIAVFLINPDTTHSQILWSKTYGVNNSSNFISTVVKTNDGGFLIAGTREFSSEYDYYSNIYLVKTDSVGSTIWEKLIGGANDVDCASILQLPGKEYMLVGSSDESHPGSRVADFLLMKIDSIGNKIWSKTIGGTKDDYCSSVVPTNDGGYVLLGSTNSFGAGASDMYLVKTDSLGNLLWSKTFGGSGADEGKTITTSAEAGYILAGNTNSYGAGGLDMYVIRTDSVGNTLWDKTIGGTNTDNISSLLSINGGYIIGGSTNSDSKTDMYLIKIDTIGNILWTNNFGGNGYENCNTVNFTNGSGYLLGGYTNSFNSKSNDMYIVNADSSGNIKWDQLIGTMDDEECYVILPLNDGQFVLGGMMGNAGNYKYHLVKLKPDTTIIHRDDSLANGSLLDIYTTGPQSKRINIVYLAEAYTQQDSIKFVNDLKKLSSYFQQTPPFSKYADYFNHYGIFVQSKTSALDSNSYFQGYHTSGYRLSIKNTSEVDRLVNKYVPVNHVVAVIVNNYGISVTQDGMIVSLPANETFVHEFGHAFANLGDEYESSSSSYPMEHWNVTQETDLK